MLLKILLKAVYCVPCENLNFILVHHVSQIRSHLVNRSCRINVTPTKQDIWSSCNINMYLKTVLRGWWCSNWEPYWITKWSEWDYNFGFTGDKLASIVSDRPKFSNVWVWYIFLQSPTNVFRHCYIIKP